MVQDQMTHRCNLTKKIWDICEAGYIRMDNLSLANILIISSVLRMRSRYLNMDGFYGTLLRLSSNLLILKRLEKDVIAMPLMQMVRRVFCLMECRMWKQRSSGLQGRAGARVG